MNVCAPNYLYSIHILLYIVYHISIYLSCLFIHLIYLIFSLFQKKVIEISILSSKYFSMQSLTRSQYLCMIFLYEIYVQWNVQTLVYICWVLTKVNPCVTQIPVKLENITTSPGSSVMFFPSQTLFPSPQRFFISTEDQFSCFNLANFSSFKIVWGSPPQGNLPCSPVLTLTFLLWVPIAQPLASLNSAQRKSNSCTVSGGLTL